MFQLIFGLSTIVSCLRALIRFFLTLQVNDDHLNISLISVRLKGAEPGLSVVSEAEEERELDEAGCSYGEAGSTGTEAIMNLTGESDHCWLSAAC